MSGQNYRNLIAWQKAMDLVEEVYRLSALFPPDELYGLTSQIRRAVVSIPSNIAEGQGRNSTNEFHRFLNIAHGSLRELETQLAIAVRLNYVPGESIHSADELCQEAGRLINGLLKSLRQ